MKKLSSLALCATVTFIAMALAACAAKAPPPVKTALAAAEAPASTPEALTASIRGSRERNVFDSEGVYVAGIDGKMIRQSGRTYENPIAIAPGPHSLLIGSSRAAYGTLHTRLEAKEGASYVLRWESDATGIPIYGGTMTVWIEDEASGELVMPKRNIWGEISKNATYVSPDIPEQEAALISGVKPEGFPGVDHTYLAAVDGVYTADNKASRMPIKVRPGKRALLLGYYSGGIAEYPVLVDLQAGHSYVIGFVSDLGAVPGLANERLSIWLDDQTTGVRVVPAQRVMVQRIRRGAIILP
ncbi:MAG: hypothetical protein Q7V31_14245 [Parvibaculum sp.]|uniref:hypothetical protein n=1 Tax=Parvibaculum sp. TaxID=2024848 RepID=UPI0027257C9D|nr:hypothetical protein [Parvibaculum sp.]MDO8840077.1 hypothetical protein [Parvibaculum sp.]